VETKKTYIEEIKRNISERRKSDKIMWFSMWFLLSIITFGLTLFPMVYFLIERRNRHFQRQENLERLLVSALKEEGVNLKIEAAPPPCKRKALLWTVSIPLIVPIFLISYYLCEDLHLHEKRQKIFFGKIFPGENILEQKINSKLYLVITIGTLGFGIIYWLYKIFNAYNTHFKEQWRIEDRLIELLNGKFENSR